jgi:hypothetical protein
MARRLLRRGMNWFFYWVTLAVLLLGGHYASQPARAAERRQIGGVYPHLAMFNNGNECGTGAVVPWAGKLWVVTYSPHQPQGSDDKLYEITPALEQRIRPESIGGTPANRMIHQESGQLFIGPYAVDREGNVRVIPYSKMLGRPTGNARHLNRPAELIYYATMEEGFYEVDVRTLEVKQLYEDANAPQLRGESDHHAGALLPGYHGKGFYSGQGRVVYANNGEVGGADLKPDIPSGCLAEWDGKNWTVVRRNQFTEVTGPGGIQGNPDPQKDPIWSVGWDHRSLILMLLDGGKWYSYRLPKASHTYDGAHGWNTEWPRIRDTGEADLLMTMHGMFWRFPRTFSAARSSGIVPRSTYLRVIGDFTQWRDRVVMGSDDTAKAEFYNVRRAKGDIAGPGQSQSNLWFVEPSRLDRLGVPIGSGGTSEPYLFSGFQRRMVHLTHQSPTAVRFTFEVDRTGNGQWVPLRELTVEARGYRHLVFETPEEGAWVRVKTDQDVREATVFFEYSNADGRTSQTSALFRGLARKGQTVSNSGWVWARGDNRGTLLFAAGEGNREPESLYEVDADLNMTRVEDGSLLSWMKQNLNPPAGVLEADAASVIYSDEAGKRWRLPKGDRGFDAQAAPVRVAREVSTERDLFNAHGTFYELPSNNAGGIALVRPVATHNLDIRDYCSWRGLLVLSGVTDDATGNDRIIRSQDGRAAVWVGVSDELWEMGKPRGHGGPWKDTQVRANQPSDPYLMAGYDSKTIGLSHQQSTAVGIRVEVDITGTGLWVPYRHFQVSPGKTVEHRFPEGFAAYWVRTVALRPARVTAQLEYR